MKITEQQAVTHRRIVILPPDEWMVCFHDGVGERAFSLLPDIPHYHQ
jgi:hypothetical protein